MITETQQQSLDKLASLLKEVRGTDNANPLGLTCEDYMEVIPTIIGDDQRVSFHKTKSWFYLNIVSEHGTIMHQVIAESLYWASKQMYDHLKSIKSWQTN